MNLPNRLAVILSEKSMNNKPRPLFAPPKRKSCPVCGETSYSAAGIHPQCAAREADAKRMQAIKPALAKAKAAAAATLNTWQKRCPKCRAIVHVRKKTCACGHNWLPTK